MTTAIFHGVENYFPRLWGTGISDAILHNCANIIDSSSENKFYSFIILIMSILINAAILLLNCIVLIPYLCMHFLSLRSYFIYLNII